MLFFNTEYNIRFKATAQQIIIKTDLRLGKRAVESWAGLETCHSATEKPLNDFPMQTQEAYLKRKKKKRLIYFLWEIYH